MSANDLQIARFRSRAGEEPDAQAIRVGHLVASLGKGRVAVKIPGVAQTLTARIALRLTAARLQAAIESQQGAVVVFEGRSRGHPIVIGLIESEVPESSPTVAVTSAEPGQPEHRSEDQSAVDAVVDGKRIRIVGSDEIVLECGKASITLRRNGKIVIRGAYVETHSEGTNRIKGAAVRIN
jgi:Domain of unknown function (DUF6484)